MSCTYRWDSPLTRGHRISSAHAKGGGGIAPNLFTLRHPKPRIQGAQTMKCTSWTETLKFAGNENWTQTFFSQTFRAPTAYASKIPGYPAQKVWFPWVSRDIPNFSPHPFMWKTPTPLKSLGSCSFFVPEFWRLKMPNSRFSTSRFSPLPNSRLVRYVPSNSRFMGCRPLLTPVSTAPFWPASQFTVCTSQIMRSRATGGIMFREYCFEEENSLSLTEFYGKLNEFCRKSVSSLWHANKSTELSPRSSLTAVFETVLSETVFGPFPRNRGSRFPTKQRLNRGSKEVKMR